MDFNSYQRAAHSTAVYPDATALAYLSSGLAAEAGEVCGKIAKTFRKDKPLDVDSVVDEIGDVLWFLSELCTHLDVALDDAADRNLAKLLDRKNRGVLKGDGDKR